MGKRQRAEPNIGAIKEMDRRLKAPERRAGPSTMDELKDGERTTETLADFRLIGRREKTLCWRRGTINLWVRRGKVRALWLEGRAVTHFDGARVIDAIEHILAAEGHLWCSVCGREVKEFSRRIKDGYLCDCCAAGMGIEKKKGVRNW